MRKTKHKNNKKAPKFGAFLLLESHRFNYVEIQFMNKIQTLNYKSK